MSHRVLVSLALALLVAGCGGGDEAGAGAAQPASGAGGNAGTAKPRTAADDMVAAASPSRAANNVELKFAIAKRPATGQPLEIDLQILPKVANTSLRVMVQNTDGVTVQSGAEFERMNGAEPNVPLTHRVIVLPERDGIFAISAITLIDTKDVSLTRVFAIPIIVGEGVVPAQLAAGTPQ
jgi:hypothetical protein